MAAWFAVLALTGLSHIAAQPGVLTSLDPRQSRLAICGLIPACSTTGAALKRRKVSSWK
jgi:hypothetical protein